MDVCHFRAALFSVPTPKLNKQPDTSPASLSLNSSSVVFLAVGSGLCGLHPESLQEWALWPLALDVKLLFQTATGVSVTCWRSVCAKCVENAALHLHNHKFHSSFEQKLTQILYLPCHSSAGILVGLWLLGHEMMLQYVQPAVCSVHTAGYINNARRKAKVIRPWPGEWILWQVDNSFAPIKLKCDGRMKWVLHRKREFKITQQIQIYYKCK